MNGQKKALVTVSPIGMVGFSEDKDIIYFELFEKDPKIAIEQFSKGMTADFLEKLKGYDVQHNELANRMLREKIRDIALDLRFASNDQEFNEFISSFCLL